MIEIYSKIDDFNKFIFIYRFKKSRYQNTESW